MGHLLWIAWIVLNVFSFAKKLFLITIDNRQWNSLCSLWFTDNFNGQTMWVVDVHRQCSYIDIVIHSPNEPHDITFHGNNTLNRLSNIRSQWETKNLDPPRIHLLINFYQLKLMGLISSFANRFSPFNYSFRLDFPFVGCEWMELMAIKRSMCVSNVEPEITKRYMHINWNGNDF